MENITFVEQAELLNEEEFLNQLATHPDEDNILGKLLGTGAKLLIGPRGSGKSTLMLKAYYETIRDNNSEILPVYVNFKNSLSLEPLYRKDIKASYIFKNWLMFCTFIKLEEALASKNITLFDKEVIKNIKKITSDLQLNNFDNAEENIANLNLDNFNDILQKCIETTSFNRVVILMDDAAHAFSIEQQHDFFEFFRALRAKNVSPKAAIYPGVTSYPPTFHVGHDAEEINVWIDPFDPKYLDYMGQILFKRTPEHLRMQILKEREKIDFFAYTSFGIPRAFLGMFFDHIKKSGKSYTLDLNTNEIYKTSKRWFDRNFSIFDSLSNKIPRYRDFIKFGKSALIEIVSEIKEFNSLHKINNQSVMIGIKTPVPIEFKKILQFYQYSGLVLPKGNVSRGEKGDFDLFAIHYGLLAESNAVVVAKAKKLVDFNIAFQNRKAHAFTRTTTAAIFKDKNISTSCSISLPNCPSCKRPRIIETLKFCGHCGFQLSEPSIFLELIEKDIGALPITAHRAKKIKELSKIKTIKDILIDNEHKELRSVDQVGPFWADKIYRMAEEYIS